MGFSSELKYSCFQVEKKSLILANLFSCESFRCIMNSRIHKSVEMCFHVGFVFVVVFILLVDLIFQNVFWLVV